MSLGASISLSKDPATDVDTNLRVFDLRAADLARSEFSVAGLTLPNERTLVVSHETMKDGSIRTMSRINETVVDAVLVPATASVYCVFHRPANTAVTDVLMKELVNMLVDFLVEGTNANVTKLLNREV